MARIARVVIPAYPHHTIHRGNRREKVFFNEDDKLVKGVSSLYVLDPITICVVINGKAKGWFKKEVEKRKKEDARTKKERERRPDGLTKKTAFSNARAVMIK